MWDGHPANRSGTGLTSRLHVGKVWRDQTDKLSVSAHIPADIVGSRFAFPPSEEAPQ
ncbi:hypothetical protein GCM10010172_14190 [Paractinoplanes ferrugineus]|uniref:Uncharacterized protein n=1 Tax=Paractinoplanes ferrugineus TaxID=113564 RepID=A0A919J065_9ACTN|nr:hypothetical protein Afe05nite_18240 [Actinoplanes ferrugineus]